MSFKISISSAFFVDRSSSDAPIVSLFLTGFWLENCYEPDWCAGTDLTAIIGSIVQPGLVDLSDFSIFAKYWLNHFSTIPITNSDFDSPPGTGAGWTKEFSGHGTDGSGFNGNVGPTGSGWFDTMPQAGPGVYISYNDYKVGPLFQ